MKLPLLSRYKNDTRRWFKVIKSFIFKKTPLAHWFKNLSVFIRKRIPLFLFKRFPQKSKIIVGVLFACMTILLLTHCSQNMAEIERQKAAGKEAITVTTAVVMKQDVPIELAVVGNVYPHESVAIKARIDSQITKINFKDGDMVEKDAVLFELDDRALQAQLTQLEANHARDEAQRINAQKKLGRDGKLLGQGYSSRAQYDNSTAANDGAMATIASDKAAIDNVKVQIDYATIRAPITGRAGTINITQGNTVKANDTQALVTINQVKPIWVQMAVPQRYYDPVRTALAKGPVKVIAKGDHGQEIATGILEYINNTIDTATGAFAVRARFENTDEALWPGMFVTTVVSLGIENDAHVIPLEAVQNSQTGTFVFSINADNKAIKKAVTLLRSVKQLAVIKSDLKEGDKIITDNIVRLNEGSKVTIATKEKETEK
jgi:multidrug efflux system membrane fusion protein